MKAAFALHAVLVALLPALASCAVSAGGPPEKASVSGYIALTNDAGTVSLRAPADRIGPFELRAFGGTLFQSDFTSSTGNSLPWLRIGGNDFPPLTVEPSTSLEGLRSNDWHYAALNAVPTVATPLKIARRHLLLIEPDLVVVLDEFVPTSSVAMTLNLPSRSSLQHDSVRDEWTSKSDHAGLVARLLTLPQSTQRWTLASTTDQSGRISSSVPESGPEFHHLTILAVHPGEKRRSLAFKLLESDTAIGARIHRDGLPTLVAFRKASCSGEANLTGLKFTAPVAVDVFRPKPRPQRPR